MTTYTGTNANNTLNATTAVSNDDMYGLDGNDTLNAYAGNDTLDGGSGNDTLNGGAGADILIGGDGLDTATYSASTVAVTVNLATGVGTWGDAAGDTFSSIERLTGSAHNDTLVGDAGDNSLHGGNGNDTLDGGLGNDTLNGGNGADIVTYAWATSAISVDLYSQTVGGAAAGDTLSYVEGVIGTAYNDTLEGGSGSTRFEGGLGDDVYVIRSGSTVVVEEVGAGYDEVQIRGQLSYLVPANVEKVVGIGPFGSSGFNVTANSAGVHIVGGDVGDTLVGGAGADTLDGGGGVDLLNCASFTSGVGIYLAANFGTGAAAGDTFYNIEKIWATDFSDVLWGNSSDNYIDGRDGGDFIQGDWGNDTLRGGDGYDTILGGVGNDIIYTDAGGAFVDGESGNDTIYLNGTNDVVRAYVGMGVDTVYSYTYTTDRVQVNLGAAYTVGVVGSDLVVDFGGGDQLVLKGLASAYNNGLLPPGWIFES